MSPEVHRLFSPEIRDQCFSRFGVTAAQLVSNRHAFIFDAETVAGPCILKVVHPTHRPCDQLEAEIDWMLFLRALLLGYREEHDLSRTEIEALPLFLQLREVLIYTAAMKMLDLNNLTPIQARLL